MLVGVTIPGFASAQNLLNVMWAAAPLGCMVLGLFLVLLIKEVDLSLESTFAFSPTVAIVAMQQWLPAIVTPIVAVIATPLIGLCVGAAAGTFAVKLRVNAFLVTLATLLLMRGAVVYLIPEGVYYLPTEYTYLGEQRWFGIPIAIFVWLLLYFVAYIIMERHRIGKEIYAIGNNEEAAFLAGVKVQRTKIFCFAIAGFAAAVGGLLEVGRLQSAVADLGEGSILMVFAGTILGGTSLSGGVGPAVRRVRGGDRDRADREHHEPDRHRAVDPPDGVRLRAAAGDLSRQPAGPLRHAHRQALTAKDRRAPMASLLGIDSGLTVTKAVVFDEDGSTACGRPRRCRNPCRRPGSVERDLGRASGRQRAEAIREAIGDSADRPTADIRAVAVTAHGDGLYLLDRDKRPLGPGILSLDSRAGGIIGTWKADGVAARRWLDRPGAACLRAVGASGLDQAERTGPLCRHRPCARLQGLAALLPDAVTIGTDRTEASTSFTDVRDQEYTPAALDLYGSGRDLPGAAAGRLLREVVGR